MRRLCLALFSLASLAFAQAPAKPAAALPRVRIETNYGPITLELEPEKAPKTVENFLGYVKSGHFTGTIFHRVISGFMIQGGGMTESMVEKEAKAPITNEAARSGLKNLKGTIAMARTSDPDSAQAQFFINTADNPALDPKAGEAGYAVFGRVVEGMENVLKIDGVKTVWRKGSQNVPDYPVRIKAASLVAP